MKSSKLYVIASSILLSSTMFSCSNRVYEHTALYTPAAPAEETAEVDAAALAVAQAEDFTSSYTWVQLSSTDCCYSLLTDDLISSSLRGKAATFPVIIEEALEAPGMYRLVNPMRAFSMSGEAARTSYDIIINATDPDRVVIEKQSTGVDLGSGAVAIESMASHFAAKGSPSILIEDAGYYGKLTDGEIVFPRGGSFLLWANEASEKANVSGSLRIVLPEKVAAVERTMDRSDYGLGLEYIARMEETGLPAYELDPAALSTDSYALK